MLNFTNIRFEISQLLFSRTIKNTGVVFAGNIIASGFSFLIILILTRSLGPEIFGVLSIINSITLLLISLTDLGIAVGLSKFVAPLEKASKPAISFFRTVFWIELLLGFLTVLLGFIFLDPISRLLGVAQLRNPLILGFLVAGILSFNAYIPMVLQALQRFWTIAVFSVLSNFLKLFLIAAFFYTGYLTLWNALYINLFASLGMLLIGLFVIPKFFASSIDWKEDIKTTQKLFSFTKWLAISYGLSAVAARLDILMLSHFRTPLEVGYYALAFQLSSAFPLLLGAVSTVLIPKVAAFKSKMEIISYIKKSLTTSLVVLTLSIPFLFTVPSLIVFAFGIRFTPSVLIMQILIVNFVLTLIINPISLIFYVLNKPQVLTLMNFIFLISLGLLYTILIPLYGGYGAAIAITINTFTAGILLGLVLLVFYYRGGFNVKKN